jgi:prolyl-tRNA editing enzyme YbaK/EbsC (Cys-tRNA(Pro) deacylase)
MSEITSDLPNYLEVFLASNNDLIKARTIPHEDIPSDALIVKSLVWTYQRVNPVLVVLDLRSSVDKTKLAKYLNLHTKHMRMATPELVLDVTGQTVGNVSPIGHKQAVRTIVDESLLRAYGIDQSSVTTVEAQSTLSDVICYGGGGSTGRELQISLGELLAVSKAEIADVSAASPAAAAGSAGSAGDAADGSAEEEGAVSAPISAPIEAAGTC